MNIHLSLEAFLKDLRHAVRGLWKHAGFTMVAIVTLALGIAATTSIFSVVNGVLIKPLPYPQSEALVGIWHSAQFQGVTSNNVRLSSTMYLTYAAHNETFQEFGLWHDG